VLPYLQEYFFNLLSSTLPYNPIPIFWFPRQMIYRKRDAPFFGLRCVFIHHILSAFGRRTFNPRLQDGVFKCGLK
jgi:hypothetical protein